MQSARRLASLQSGAHEIDTNHRARLLVILDTGKQPPDFRCGLLSSFIDAARDDQIAQV
ncbi:MAG: hypothetical protein R3C56_16725 [Pirellulaceae bacterium]